MATKTQPEIKAALLAVYNSAKATQTTEDAFAEAIATVLNDMQLAIVIQLDTLVATDSLSGPVTLVSGVGSVTP